MISSAWLLALACAPGGAPAGADEVAPETAAAVFERLAAPGPHAVGYREDSLAWDDPDTGPRENRLAVWWPTDVETGIEARYWRGAIPAGPGVFEGAPVAPGAHRVVVFSHGHLGYAENSSFLAEHLASWGLLVVAPDHTGNTTLDSADRETAIYLQRPGDVAATLSWVLDPGEDPVRASADATDPVLVGHSFGGYTAFAALGAAFDPAALACADGAADPLCSAMTPALSARFSSGFADSRWAAGVAMAPGDFDRFGDGVAAVGAPVLVAGGGLDAGGDGSDYWEVLAARPVPADDRWLRIDAAGHQSFTDFSGLLESVDGLIPAADGFRIVDAYVLGAVLAAGGDASVAPLLSAFPGPLSGVSLVGVTP